MSDMEVLSIRTLRLLDNPEFRDAVHDVLEHGGVRIVNGITISRAKTYGDTKGTYGETKEGGEEGPKERVREDAEGEGRKEASEEAVMPSIRAEDPK